MTSLLSWWLSLPRGLDSFEISQVFFFYPLSTLPSVIALLLHLILPHHFLLFFHLSLSVRIFVLYFFCNFLFSLLFASTLLCTASLSIVVFSTSGKAQRWVGLNFEMKFQTTAHTPRVSVHFEWEVRMIKRDRWCVYGMSLLASPGLSSSWWPSAAAVAALFVHETSESFLHPRG